MPGRWCSKRTGLGALVVLALVAGACGDDSDDDGVDDEIEDAEAGAGDGTDTAADPFYGGHVSELYGDDANWLCKPGIADDVCDEDLDATAVFADGTTEVQPHERADDPAIDCFYVYPTVSGDEGPNADLEVGEGEEIYVTLNQAARFTASCRVFAPVYRQMTLGMIGGGAADADVDPWEVAYDDVVDAFRHYIDNESDGRGFVLIGHSQGSSHLRRLMVEEIDDEPELRERLVSALLTGWSVNVPEGETVGEDFDNIPACEAADQVGCVISYASFRSEPSPPPAPAFGQPRDGDGMALCVNPGAPGGGSSFTRPYFQLDPPEGSLVGDTDVTPFADPERTDEITTPWVTYPDFIEVECRYEEGISYLAVTVHGDEDDERTDDIGGDLDLGEGLGNWGLHRVDVNIAIGDLVDLVGSQGDAYDG